MPVSEEHRKSNLTWIRRRDKWRKQYKSVQDEILWYKEEIAHHHREGQWWIANRHLIALRSLQQIATIMMDERAEITMHLKVTSYRYE